MLTGEVELVFSSERLVGHLSFFLRQMSALFFAQLPSGASLSLEIDFGKDSVTCSATSFEDAIAARILDWEGSEAFHPRHYSWQRFLVPPRSE